MNRCYFIDHKGTRIYYIDFTNLRTEKEIEEVMIESKTLIRSSSKKSMINLANIEGMHFNNTIKELFTEYVKGNADYVQKSAIIGVTGLKRIVFNGIMKLTGRDVNCLNSVEEAKNWLTSPNRK
ncbi:MAG TPA: hypothetical protein PLS94_09510 [Prolixibacteraceae bacterium]|nr:hypothetical protein [Prolixibacteraceae bacterium]HPR59824.1 hypothetical protein [Prolixibacteraceae bacterium]